ncbi:MAG: ABC transporter ATP-binding protein [Ectothiorhodospiraceae bacterium]|nr:ABC transporter ATP-binding protein [Ectothiorhodospiraceae bacterium]
MFEVYRKLYEILDARERKLTVIVLLLFIVVAFVEAVGVASIMPFMAVLANPEVVETNRYLALAYDTLGFESTDAFLVFLGFVFLVLIVGSLVFRAFAFWVQVRFSQKRNYAWSSRLVERHLNRPYEWFLNQHSGALASSVLSEVQKVVNGALFPALQVVSHGLVAVFLFGLLVGVDPLLAISVAIILGGAYGALYVTVRRYLARIGTEVKASNRERFRLTQEMFGGIKDVKIYGLETPFQRRFRRPALIYAQRQIAARVLSELPSFAMQALVFGGVMVVLLYFLGDRGGLQTALPVFSLFALAGYRLMPSLQAIYSNLSQMRVNLAVLDAIHQGLCQETTHASTRSVSGGTGTKETAMGLRQQLELANVTYSYPQADRPALKSVSLTIRAYSTVGLVGPTGSGKTTLVDVMLGLLEPHAGGLVADGVPITGENRRAWQRSIGYVPQQIFLADDTISGNIAFGIPPDQIDHQAVEKAARVANLHDFVVTQLKDGYNTMVGERGVRLSGGQRQRIGIARALYRDPDVLILDEATSALDNRTEQAVMEAVHNLGNQKTIVLIAHRLSTVRECDLICFIESGEVIVSGKYDELLESSADFRGLVGKVS